MKFASFFRCILMVLVFWGGYASAETIKVKPKLVYIPVEKTADTACIEGYCFDSPSAAFSAHKAIFLQVQRDWSIKYNNGVDVTYRYRLLDDLHPTTSHNRCLISLPLKQV